MYQNANAIFTTSATLGRWPVQPHLYKRPQHRQSISIFYTSCDFQSLYSMSIFVAHSFLFHASIHCTIFFYSLNDFFYLIWFLIFSINFLILFSFLISFTISACCCCLFQKLHLMSSPSWSPPDVFYNFFSDLLLKSSMISFMISTWCFPWTYPWYLPDVFHDCLHDLHLISSMITFISSTWCLLKSP